MEITPSPEIPDVFKTLLDSVLKTEKLKRSSQRTLPLKKLLLFFMNDLSTETYQTDRTIRSMLQKKISELNQRISSQLNEILHQPTFQRMESAWRGLNFLVSGINKEAGIKVKVLDVKKKELLKDFAKMIDFDQSILFKLVYESEYGTYGGTPFSILIGDYEFSHKPKDINLLQNISHVTSAAHALFISSASPVLLDMERFSDLNAPRDIHRIFKRRELIKWHSFRKTEDSRYVSLVLPHILLRLPYGRKYGRLHPGPILYEEDVAGKTPDKYLWGNAAYALGQRICESFTRYGWPVRFFGVDGPGAGAVDKLPVPVFDSIDLPKMSTDVLIMDSVEKELSNQGLISLCHCRMKTFPAFFSVQSIHKPKTYFMNSMTSNNDRLSSMLPHILTASRFAHYIKVIMREKVGKFKNLDDIQLYINNWLNQYILAVSDSTIEQKAQSPLLDGKVTVVEAKDHPNRFKAVIQLRPHYQLESLIASLRLITDLSDVKQG